MCKISNKLWGCYVKFFNDNINQMPNKMDIWPFEDDEHHDVQPFAVSNFTAFSASIEFSENSKKNF